MWSDCCDWDLFMKGLDGMKATASMKVTAGLGSIDDYPLYVQAGADELFCGYVPEAWTLAYGTAGPMNRREVCYYQVQIGSFSELEILAKMVSAYQVPVSITLNSLTYCPQQFPELIRTIERCRTLGFTSWIVADPAFLLALNRLDFPDISVHVSGELGEINHEMVQKMRAFDVSRIIFHRKVTLADMKACIAWDRQKNPCRPLEYEAFILNEMCHFTGAFCNSLHCDELAPVCRLPYSLGRVSSVCTDEKIREEDQKERKNVSDDLKNSLITGAGGCGLCALWRLREAGVTYLKVVSRGNHTDATAADIRAVKTAVRLLDQAESEADYIRQMKAQLFSNGCGRVCYYPELM